MLVCGCIGAYYFGPSYAGVATEMDSTDAKACFIGSEAQYDAVWAAKQVEVVVAPAFIPANLDQCLSKLATHPHSGKGDLVPRCWH